MRSTSSIVGSSRASTAADGQPMPANVARANGAKSKVCAGVEHVFARQKGPMALFVRTIGIARAAAKIGLANIACK
jgi:hypothetical protein